jgi:Ni/Co efflux regulator RcnB
MKRLLIHVGLATALALTVAAPTSLAKQTRAHRAAIRLCKQKYKDAIRGSRYLKGHDRRARRAQARSDRADCERLAPR